MDMSQRSRQKAPAQAGGLDDALRLALLELAETKRERDALTETVRLGIARERLVDDAVEHRISNLLAVIRSLLRRTLDASPSPDQFVDHFEGRLTAIARYQVGNARDRRRVVELEDIVRDELLPTRCLDTPDCSIEGPAINIEDEAVDPITLAIHELATNSFKFGALKGHGGRLAIGWSLTENADDTILHFEWAEAGVPIIATAPHPRGFGREFIENALPYQLGAATTFELKPGGVACTIFLPLRRAERSRPGALPQPDQVYGTTDENRR